VVTTACGTSDSGPEWSRSELDGINVHTLKMRCNNRMGFRRRILAFLEFAILAARKSVLKVAT
jgi:hypothetical protein